MGYKIETQTQEALDISSFHADLKLTLVTLRIGFLFGKKNKLTRNYKTLKSLV